ncbi:hypothetical protein M9H77_27260 [Catharanthus roseus]|uniref:Uncharacterized protein n=1 Tax=Catharanthus roseus TaxID=4058 RepID=A0ACC0ABZ6_CATRO|nr:hypothetical protein M9H77_27260 [Catharanthus roseus]
MGPKHFLLPCFLSLMMMMMMMISLSLGIKHETLYNICSQTQNEETCVKILETDSRTDSSTLPQLSLISINLTRNQAIQNLKKFVQLSQSQNPTADIHDGLLLKGSYEDCVIIYKLILKKIEVAYALSKKGKYKEIIQLGQSQDLAYRCENGIPPNWNNYSTAGISEDMILTCEASASVNLYVANNYVPKAYYENVQNMND